MNTKTPLALAMSALMAIAVTGCNRNDDANGGTNNTPSATDTAAGDVTGTQPAGPAVPAGSDTAAMGGAPTQAEALALVNVINEHEVRAAEMAKSKNVTGPALEYANMMQAEHNNNMTQTTALLQQQGATAADGPRVSDQRTRGEAKRNQLQGLEGQAFAKAYIDAMVMDHQEALTMLDSQLIPAATDEAVRTHLTTTRQHVQKHLERAQQIQGQMGGTAGAQGAAGTSGQGGGTGQG